MIGIVLIAHGALGLALRDAMEHVVGAQAQVATVSVGPEDDVSAVRDEVNRCIDVVDTGDGALLLTDMFGGTPSNVAVSLIDRGGVEIISGVNLPMLVKLAKARAAGTLGECADCAEMAVRNYIAMASHLPRSCLGGSACVSLASVTQAQVATVAAPVADPALLPDGRPG